jgi:hypothetical protein
MRNHGKFQTEEKIRWIRAWVNGNLSNFTLELLMQELNTTYKQCHEDCNGWQSNRCEGVKGTPLYGGEYGRSIPCPLCYGYDVVYLWKRIRQFTWYMDDWEDHDQLLKSPFDQRFSIKGRYSNRSILSNDDKAFKIRNVTFTREDTTYECTEDDNEMETPHCEDPEF